MFAKVLFLCALVGLTFAQYGGQGGEGYGHHAVSSQSFVRHEAPQKKVVAVPVVPVHKVAVAPVVAVHAAVAAPAHHSQAVSSQSYVSHQAPVHYAPKQVYQAPVAAVYKHHQEEEEYGHPAYKFEYHVQDPHTGDEKSQSESRDGDHVEGQYSFLQPDGKVRTVVYSSDKHSGFNAHVSYSEGPKQHQGYN